MNASAPVVPFAGTDWSATAVIVGAVFAAAAAAPVPSVPAAGGVTRAGPAPDSSAPASGVPVRAFRS
ncbi:MAG: hypothetical protein K2X82_29990 [Gemmataceae bacterium]|nr:hypothetical protein [Gemmataceae bacterium]